jgi:hypothetical protein
MRSQFTYFICRRIAMQIEYHTSSSDIPVYASARYYDITGINDTWIEEALFVDGFDREIQKKMEATVSIYIHSNGAQLIRTRTVIVIIILLQ